mmetsp:Transcript_58313/g.117143  ORF Transcript_58313/g.117143 Transcript_58313/m.117143 type:complete len:291 (+) Transcript_58313:76-948(+)
MSPFWLEFFSRQSAFLIVLAGICWALPYIVAQRQRFPQFCCTLDQQYLSVGEQIVPSPVNWILCSTLPLVIHGIYVALLAPKRNDIKIDEPNETIAFIHGICMSASVAEGLFSTFLKRFVGRPRPHFFSRCGWNGTSCTKEIDIGAYQSFPSGHATLAFSTLGFTSLYLLGKIHCLKPQPSSMRAFLNFRDGLIVLALIPLGPAFWVSASRVVDHEHHASDVVAGALVGFAFAALFYTRHFHDKSTIPELTVLSPTSPTMSTPIAVADVTEAGTEELDIISTPLGPFAVE